MNAFSSARSATRGTGTRWLRRKRPTSPSTPPFSCAPSMPGVVNATRTGSASGARRSGRLSTRRRPFSTFFTAEVRLSKRICANTPPNHSNACTCSSRNACWVSTSEAWQNAAPENDARMTNRCTVVAHARRASTSASPQSTSAPTPGRVHLRDEHLPDRPAHRALAPAHVLPHRRPPRPRRRARRRAAARSASRCAAASAAPPDRPQATRRSAPDTGPASAPAGPPAPASPAATATPAPASPPADEPHAAPPTPGSTTPPDRGPA